MTICVKLNWGGRVDRETLLILIYVRRCVVTGGTQGCFSVMMAIFIMGMGAVQIVILNTDMLVLGELFIVRTLVARSVATESIWEAMQMSATITTLNQGMDAAALVWLKWVGLVWAGQH